MDFISSTNTVGVFYECFEIGYHSHSKNTPGSFLGMDTSGSTTQMTNDPSTAMATDTTESGATGVIATTSITPVVRVLSFFYVSFIDSGTMQDFTVIPMDVAADAIIEQLRQQMQGLTTPRPVARSCTTSTSPVARSSSTVHRGTVRSRSPTPEATTRTTELNRQWGTQKVLVVERDTMQTKERITSRDHKIQSLTSVVCNQIFFVDLR